MRAVDLVVTDTRIWARGAATHWDVPPSVVLGSDGDLVVGEPLTPPTQVSSAVAFIAGERIALLPRVPAVSEAMTSVIGTVLRNLNVETPCDRVTVVCPTEWGARKRGVLDAAIRRFAGDVVFEDMAIRAVAVDEGTGRSRRTVVLEFGSLSTTATAVVRDHQGAHIESCEYEPSLALADLIPDSRGINELAALIGRLLAGQPADVVQTVGVSDPAKLDLIRAAVQPSGGPAIEVRPIAGADLVRGPQPQPGYRPDAAPALPATEWMQPLRQRAAAQQAPARRRNIYIAAGAAAVIVVTAAAIGVVIATGSDDNPAAVAATSTPVPATLRPTAEAKPSPSIAPNSSTETIGRVRFQIPPGWRTAQVADPGKPRVDLVPEDGSRMRITVTQTPVVTGTGYEQVAANLETQLRQKPNGTLTDLKRDQVFGGKSGLSYIEHPTDGSTVRWHVLVEHGMQVSTGCQYVDNWEAIAPPCELVASSLIVAP
ncbi:type VII secretion-associated protein [Nocardia australiensis]|uniref:type VII secretion-associated protein n=1 Tax=Nocardia australiensis TaxID=2887191 RepID=UPI001D1462DD|nr:type VII secretion-associated protein [Nocardia australiensis]